jgi:2-phosphoglycerate kinase
MRPYVVGNDPVGGHSGVGNSLFLTGEILPNSIDNLVTSHLLKEILRKPQIKSPKFRPHELMEGPEHSWRFQ